MLLSCFTMLQYVGNAIMLKYQAMHLALVISFHLFFIGNMIKMSLSMYHYGVLIINQMCGIKGGRKQDIWYRPVISHCGHLIVHIGVIISVSHN